MELTRPDSGRLLERAAPARAGNLDAFYLSGDAARRPVPSAQTSKVGGAAWYNPAALASLTGLRLDVGVTRPAVKFRRRGRLGSSHSGHRGHPLHPPRPERRCPPRLTLTRRFGPFGAAFGIFVPAQSASALRTHFESPPNEDGTQIDYAYDASTRFQSYHAGLALGFDAAPRLSLGGSFLVNYQTLVDTLSTSLITTRPSGNLVQSSHYTLDSVQPGAEFIFGLRYTFLRDGALLVSYGHPASSWPNAPKSWTRGWPVEPRMPTAALNSPSHSRSIPASSSPFRVHGGISHDFSPAWRGAIDASLLFPSEASSSASICARPADLRVGVRHQLAKRVALGGGLFTDRSPNGEPEDFQDTQLDFYGATIGVDLGTIYGVFAKNDVPYTEPKGLRFGTTFALSYAVGTGTVMQAQVAQAADGTVDRMNVPQHVVAHEFTLHVGQTVME